MTLTPSNTPGASGTARKAPSAASSGAASRATGSAPFSEGDGVRAAPSPFVARNRNAAASRERVRQKRLEAKMAGTEWGSAPVKAPTLKEILARISAPKVGG